MKSSTRLKLEQQLCRVPASWWSVKGNTAIANTHLTLRSVFVPLNWLALARLIIPRTAALRFLKSSIHYSRAGWSCSVQVSGLETLAFFFFLHIFFVSFIISTFGSAVALFVLHSTKLEYRILSCVDWCCITLLVCRTRDGFFRWRNKSQYQPTQVSLFYTPAVTGQSVQEISCLLGSFTRTTNVRI